MEKKTSVTANGLLWFGAAISIAEMLSGTFFASLGVAKGILAIVLGHVIGGALMFFAGLIGAKTKKSAMETVALSFGRGNTFFSSLNVIQLVGWTAVMILSGAQACQLFLPMPTGFWVAVLGLLTAIWVLVGLGNLGKLNLVAMLLLLATSVYLTILLAGGNVTPVTPEDISFGGAVELAVAMPLSWLPLIADYTSQAKNPVKANWVSVLIYSLASSWMFLIGFFGVLITGKLEIAAMMASFGLGGIALVIIIFSTITTTFLDVYSAGVSGHTLFKKMSVKTLGLIACIVGTLLALVFPITRYETFLYFIGAVFVPMIVIQIFDYFIFHRTVAPEKIDVMNLILWLVGFILYQFFLKISTPVGSTLPVIVCHSALIVLVNCARRKKDVRKLS